ncbi:MAG: hypothetical protein HY761_07150 [Candidatus Omnitrophica bacterium]|nr:hypothetical protein [Candidatus Omnitrophota bacterium]
MLRYFLVVLMLVFFVSCNSQAPYKDVEHEFLKDNPDSTILDIIPEATPSLNGLLGNEAYVLIKFDKKDSKTNPHAVEWLCVYSKGKWIYKDKDVKR